MLYVIFVFCDCCWVVGEEFEDLKGFLVSLEVLLGFWFLLEKRLLL